MVRKTKRGGMIRAVARPLGKATVALGESVGKDYLQNKSLKVAKGIYDDPSLATNPSFITTGIKPMTKPSIKIYNKENVYSNENANPNIQKYTNPNMFENFGGKSRRIMYKNNKTSKRQKTNKKKTRKNRK